MKDTQITATEKVHAVKPVAGRVEDEIHHVSPEIHDKILKLLRDNSALLTVLREVELIASVNGPAITDGCPMHKRIQRAISQSEAAS